MAAPRLLLGLLPVHAPQTNVRSPVVKKGRHRRFEEARKLKQAGPTAFDLGFGPDKEPKSEDDEYAALAEKYGVVFDDDDADVDDDDDLDHDPTDAA